MGLIATPESAPDHFSNSGRSNHIQTQTRLTNFRFSSADNALRYIFSSDIFSEFQTSISSWYICLHFYPQCMTKSYLPPKYHLASSASLHSISPAHQSCSHLSCLTSSPEFLRSILPPKPTVTSTQCNAWPIGGRSQSKTIWWVRQITIGKQLFRTNELDILIKHFSLQLIAHTHCLAFRKQFCGYSYTHIHAHHITLYPPNGLE